MRTQKYEKCPTIGKISKSCEKKAKVVKTRKNVLSIFDLIFTFVGEIFEKFCINICISFLEFIYICVSGMFFFLHLYEFLHLLESCFTFGGGGGGVIRPPKFP